MYLSTIQIAAALLATSLALPQSPSKIGRGTSSGIQWSPCGLSSTDALNRTFPILFGTLAVPLDYTDPNCSSTIGLPLLKIAATNSSTKQPTVLTNYGGPGINGTVSMAALGANQKG